MHRSSQSDNGHIPSTGKLNRRAGLEHIIFRGNGREFAGIKACVNRAMPLQNAVRGHKAALAGIAGSVNLKTRHPPDKTDVVYLVVGNAVGPVAETGVHSVYLHIAPRIADVNLELFIGTGNQKRRGVTRNRNYPAVGHTRRHAHQVLLGNAHVDDPVRKQVLHGFYLAGTHRVADEVINIRALFYQVNI